MNTEFIALEVPHMGEPQAYYVADADSLLRQCLEHNAMRDGEVYEETTAAQLADSMGEITPAIAALIERYGMATPLYRADFLNGTLAADYSEAFGGVPIDIVDACTAYLAHDLSGFRLVTEDTLADVLADLEGPNAPRIGKCGPVAAARTLRREAIEIGWIEAES